MTQKVLIAYHSSCSDGQMAAFVAWKYFNRTPATVAVNYDSHKLAFTDLVCKLTKDLTAGEDLQDYQLVIVDFSFKPDVLLQLAGIFGQVLMIDHHLSAQEDLDKTDWESTLYKVGEGKKSWYRYHPKENLNVFFCMGESGALMTYRYFFGMDAQVPDYIAYTSDRDLFEFAHPQTRNFAAGIARYHQVSWPVFSSLLEDTDKIIHEGALAEEIRNTRINSILSRKPLVLQARANLQDTVQVGVFNAPADITSDLLAKYVNTNEDGVAIGMTYTIGADNIVYCSLRCRKDVTCLAIAKMFGGGGHEQACGFTMSLGDLHLVLTSGSLTEHLYKDFKVPQWSTRYHGSPPQKGYTLISRSSSGETGLPIAYLGDDPVVCAAVDDIVAAHNAALGKYFT